MAPPPAGAGIMLRYGVPTPASDARGMTGRVELLKQVDRRVSGRQDYLEGIYPTLYYIIGLLECQPQGRRKDSSFSERYHFTLDAKKT